MKYIKITTILFLTILLTSCYKEDKIESELGKPHHQIEFKDNPVDKYIYEMYTNTGVAILYNFSELDYKWNLGSNSLSNFKLNLQEDRDILNDGIKYLEKVLIGNYNTDFKKKHFPLNILLCDSLTVIDRSNSDPILTGRNYIAIGQINSNLKSKTAKELTELKGIINGELWGYTIYLNGLMTFPADFFAPCEDLYGYKIGSKSENPNFDSKTFGFWERDESTSSATHMAPRKEGDISQFIEMITSHSKEELMPKMEGYPILYNKYIILTNYFKSEYGLDLQAIGNNKPTVLE
ncbi:MAG: hypothetical protein WCR61_08650 [Bacteroidales bacterium]